MRSGHSPRGPHPAGRAFVGTVVQPYEPSRTHNSHLNQSQIPGIRPPRSPAQEGSATPIYDSLYAEYRRLFRALPGDRSGEEELRFEGFGTVHGTGHWSGYLWGGREPADTAWQVPPAPSWHQLPALPPAPRDGRG